jgi:ankyrin repeat protein
LAAARGNLELVEVFVAKGADISVALPDGTTALMLAKEKTNMDIVSYLKDIEPTAAKVAREEL